MSARTRLGGWILPLSLLMALLLGLLPLHAQLQPLRPYWLALACGLVADLAYGSLLGEQALRLVIMAFILQRFRARLRFFPLSQQALAIGALLVNDRIVDAAVNLALGQPLLPWEYWWAPLLGTALWPPLFLMLDALRLGRRD